MIKRVIYFSCVDLSSPDGPGVNEREFALALTQRFHKNAWVIVPKMSRPLKEFDGVNLVQFSAAKRLLTSFFGIPERLRMLFKIRQLASMDEGDAILVARPYEMPIFLAILVLFSRLPVVLKTATLAVRKTQRKDARDHIFSVLNVILLRFCFKRAIAIDTVSERFKEAIADQIGAPEKILTQRNATNVERFSKPDTPPEDIARRLSALGKGPVLGFVGSHPSDRGARQLIETAKRIIHLFPELRIVIAGDDPGMKTIKELANSYGLTGSLVHLGLVSYDWIPAVVSKFDIGFSFGPESQSENTKPGFSAQKVAQYISAGASVISVSENHGFIEENDLGLLCRVEDYDAIANGCLHLLSCRSDDLSSVVKSSQLYARRNLSVKTALDARLQFWERKTKEYIA